MNFKESKYYNEEFLGKHLYKKIEHYHKIFTAQEYFEINDEEKSYQKTTSWAIGIKNGYYKLRIFKNYYQLNCDDDIHSTFIVFDKPVHMTGKYCNGIIAPEIYIKGKKIDEVEGCVSTSLIVNNSYKYGFGLINSKINNVDFYNDEVYLNYSEIDNFYIKNINIRFLSYSNFLDYCKIRIFGKSKNLQNLKNEKESFRKRIIHIE